MSEHKSRYELWLEEEARKAQPTKKCSKCGDVKALGEYNRDCTKSTGFESSCRTCSSRPRKFKDANDRFWKQFWPRVDKVGQCLIWRGHTSNGKPACRYMGYANKSVRRIVYRLAIGELPDDMRVITTCNNSMCVSQRHLKKVDLPGLYAKMQNNAAAGDRHSSRTKPEKVPRGERSGAAKLTECHVREIRACRESGQSIDQIAAAFRIHRMSVWRIVTKKAWAHVE